MRPEMGGVIRLTAPHRQLALFLTGGAVGIYRQTGEPLVLEGVPTAASLGTFLGLVVLTIVATAAVRLWEQRGFAGRPTMQSMVMGIAGAGAGGAIVLALIAAGWAGFLVLAGIVVLEWLFHLPPLFLGRRVPVELEVLLSEGLLLPVLGALALGSPVPWELAWLTVPVAGSLAVAALPGTGAGTEGRATMMANVLTPLWAAALGLGLVSAAIALLLAGHAIPLHPELTLLASPVAIMAAVFGWIALADPRPESRYARIEILTRVAGLALLAGVLVVVLFA